MNIFKKKKTTNNQIEEKNLNTEIEMAQEQNDESLNSATIDKVNI